MLAKMRGARRISAEFHGMGMFYAALPRNSFDVQPVGKVVERFGSALRRYGGFMLQFAELENPVHRLICRGPTTSALQMDGSLKFVDAFAVYATIKPEN